MHSSKKSISKLVDLRANYIFIMLLTIIDYRCNLLLMITSVIYRRIVMKEVPKISDTEWQVMKVIWAKAPCTASIIIDELAAVTNWSPKTVKTMLGRLVKKKVVGYDKDIRSYVYYPLVAEDQCIKAESRSFLKRVYGGSLNMMLANFLEEEELSDDEIDELKRILDCRKSEGE